MNAALYIRVSTDDQLEFSPDAQKRALMEYAKKNDMYVEEQHIFIDEGISGTSAKKRPAFMRMIAIAKSKPKPFSAILVHKFDRFARSREDSVVYKSLLRKDCDIKVISITEQLEDDKFSVILEAMLEAMAEYYSLNLSDEVMKGMKEKARRGGVQHTAAYGYAIVENNFIIVNDEAEIVRLIYDKFVNQDYNYGQICSYLNNLGIKNKRGNMFAARSIKYMIENPVYCGMIRWNYRSNKNKHRLNPEEECIVSEGTHDAIISKELYQLAMNKLKKNNSDFSNKKPHSQDYKHWLGGLLRCSDCGGTITYAHYSKSSLSPGSKITGYFLCNKFRKGSCKTKNNISISKIEGHLIDTLTKLNEMLSIESDKLPIDISISDDEVEREILQKQLEKVKKKYDNAKKAYLAEVDTLEEYKVNKIDLQKEEKEIVEKLYKTKDNKAIKEVLKKEVTTALKLIKDEKVSVIEKNKALKRFIDRIIVDTLNDSLHFKFYI